LEDDKGNVSVLLVYLEILPSLFCNGVLGTAPPGVGTGSSPEYGSKYYLFQHKEMLSIFFF